MKKSELQKIIKEEIKSLIKESKTPYRHKSDSESIILQFKSPEDCQDAKQYYSQLHARTTASGKGLVIPMISVVRFLVKELQNNIYNPSED
jgi:hypothetical protein